ncbi:MAG: glycosyltransferase [Tepidisphaerales bacterium]
MDLSIVIPAYNEARKVARDIAAASEFLAGNNLSGEIIIASDGSTDDTADVAEKTPAAGDIPVVVLRLAHGGKGSALRQGMVQSRGQYAMFADSGVCVPFADALRGLALLQAGECDIANGSRRLPASVINRPQNFYRRTLSRAFRWTTLRYMGLPGHLTDTQCGFKLYKGEVARELYGQCKTDGFMFDMEILMRAVIRNYRIREFPVDWTWDTDSRLKPMRILWNTIHDLYVVKNRVRSEAR